MHMPVSLWGYVHKCRCSWRLEASDAHGVEVTGGCKPYNVDQALYMLNLRASSPVPISLRSPLRYFLNAEFLPMDFREKVCFLLSSAGE